MREFTLPSQYCNIKCDPILNDVGMTKWGRRAKLPLRSCMQESYWVHITKLFITKSDNWKNLDILEASTMFEGLVHCILFNPLKSKQFHEVGRTITTLHVKRLRLINRVQCVPNHIAKYVVRLNLDCESFDATHYTLSTRPLEDLLGEDLRLVPVTA